MGTIASGSVLNPSVSGEAMPVAASTSRVSGLRCRLRSARRQRRVADVVGGSAKWPVCTVYMLY